MKFSGWLPFFTSYLAVSLVGHLGWEAEQLPLYTIFRNETPARITYAVIHCTIGDIMIAAATFTASLVILRRGISPGKRSAYVRVAALSMLLGVSYTTFSEWLNTSRGAWSYSAAMPIVPLLGIGLAPLLQWMVVPLAAFVIAARKSEAQYPNVSAPAQCNPTWTDPREKDATHG